MNRLYVLFILIIFTGIGFAHGESLKPNKVLLVVSSYGLDGGKEQPGYEFDELAKAYLVFKANGYDIDIASPKGGPVEADRFDPNQPYNERFMADKVAMKKLENTLSSSSLNSAHYLAVYIIGGKGAMFDLPKDKALQSLIANIYENNGTVAAVCHGPAALVNVKLSNGNYLVAGKFVNGFTNEEEKAFGKKWVKHFDFMLQDKLIERGAKFVHSPMMLKHVANDSRLITGQNPFSTVATAIEVVRSLGKEPVEHVAYKDDATIELIASLLNNEPSAVTELKNNSTNYQPELIAMYGYYRMLFAESDAAVESGVNLMEIGSEYVDNPEIDIALATGYKKIGRIELAKQKLQALIKVHPDLEPAKQLLASMDAKTLK